VAVPFKTKLILVLSFALLGLVVQNFFNPQVAVLPYFWLKCPLKTWFGFECPTCGLGRSVFCTWLGRYQEALSYHLLGPLAFWLVLIILVFGFPVFLKKSFKFK
jgi:hypothetical protein